MTGRSLTAASFSNKPLAQIFDTPPVIHPPRHDLSVSPADTQQLELTGYAIQHLLQHYTPDRLAAAQGVAPSPSAPAAGAKGKGAAGAAAATAAGGGEGAASASAPGGLFSLLPEDIQPIVAPYLTTKFTLGAPKPSTDPLRGVNTCLPSGDERWELLGMCDRLCHSSNAILSPSASSSRKQQLPYSAATPTPSAAGCTCGCGGCADRWAPLWLQKKSDI
jgi:hypothetical protein